MLDGIGQAESFQTTHVSHISQWLSYRRFTSMIHRFVLTTHSAFAMDECLGCGREGGRRLPSNESSPLRIPLNSSQILTLSPLLFLILRRG